MSGAAATDRVLGAIIAGGLSSRFGSPKALAHVGGMRVVDRAARALRACIVDENVVAIVNDPELALRIGMPHRPDFITGAGALGGVHASLLWALERNLDGALVAGCDMPFVSSALLNELLAKRGDYDIVVPSSEGPRGIEPLCAFYGTGCIEAIESAIASGNARMIGFHDDVNVRGIPLDDVRAFGDPAVMFMNLNTEADRAAAEQLAREQS